MPLLEDIRLFCDSTMHSFLKPAALYAGIAVVQATPFDGLRLLLEQDHRSQLPMREICPLGKPAGDLSELSGTLEELGEAITWLDGMSLLSVITKNITANSEQSGGPRVSRLLSALERAIVPMLDDMLSAEDMAHILPRLFLHPVLVPLTPGGSPRATRLSGYVPPYIVVFYANYDAAVNTFTDRWLPFSLFRAQNACVMAAKIQAASRAEQILAAPKDDVLPEQYQHRPSRVQLDFPPQGVSVKETSPGTRENDVVSPSTFSGFSFPPRSKGLLPPPISQNPSIEITGPRRSSLAPTRQNSHNLDGGNQLQPYDGDVEKQGSSVESAPGVASWDPDWLLVLLRTKLRADA